MCSSEDMIADGRTHRQTYALITILHAPLSGADNYPPTLQHNKSEISKSVIYLYHAQGTEKDRTYIKNV